MKKHLFAIAALAASLSANVLAEVDEAQQEAFAADCKKNAMEESIPDEEMASYIEQCVQDMAAGETEGGAEEDEKSEGGAEESESESDKE